MVEDAKDKGASCLMGGAPHPAGELFYQPTILTGVQHNMALFQVPSNIVMTNFRNMRNTDPGFWHNLDPDPGLCYHFREKNNN